MTSAPSAIASLRASDANGVAEGSGIRIAPTGVGSALRPRLTVGERIPRARR